MPKTIKTMRGPRIASALALLALAVPAAAGSVAHKPVPSKAATSAKQAPLGLKGFLLRYDEATRHVFASNPAFAWRPTANAAHYEFQLATSSTFRDNSVVYENDT